MGETLKYAPKSIYPFKKSHKHRLEYKNHDAKTKN